MNFPLTTRKHLLAAALAGVVLRLFFIWRFPFEAGDTRLYEELARNWLDHGIYGLFLSGQFAPVDVRAPGYPAFLATIYLVLGRTRIAVMLVQALLDLATCLLTARLAARLAPESARDRVGFAALWLAALCPFTANYTATILTETLATFLTTAALLLLVTAYLGCGSCGADEFPTGTWFLAGLVVGVGTLARPETPLVLVAMAAVLAARWYRPADWVKLARAGVWMAAGLLLALLPWAVRNWHTLGRVQFLAARYAELPGEYVPHGFHAWTKTWLVRFGDVYLVPWKLEEEPIHVESLPASAFDSAEERARVAALLERYNEAMTITPALDREFAQLARERAARHPLRTYAWIPLGRVATMWFTPRMELLPFSGHLGPPREKWQEDPVDFSVTVGFVLLNFVYVGLALAGAWRVRKQPGVVLLVAFIVIRTAFFTEIETPEPRYVLVCFPAVLALAAQIWTKHE